MYGTMKTCVQLTVLGGAIAIAQTAARGDVTAYYTSSTQYLFDISHVPDLDQGRAALPGNGSNYCVPTSCMNWMAYFAAHGLDWFPPGPGNWMDPARYDEMTGNLDLMGQYMSTHASNGTTGSGAMAGLQTWMPPILFVTSHYYTNFWWSPDFQDMADRVFSGSYVVAVVGWYDDVDSVTIERQYGHALSLNFGARNGESRVLGWRDPGNSEGDLTQQSQYATELYALEPRWKIPQNVSVIPRPMDKVLNYGTGYLDEFFALRTFFVLTSQTDFVDVMLVKPSFVLTGSILPPEQEFHTNFNPPLLDAVIHPDLGSYLYLAEAADSSDPAQVWRYHPARGEATLIDVGLSDPSQLVVGRLRDLYVQDGDDLVQINMDIPVPEEMSRITLPGAGALTDMVYDDGVDELLLLSVGDRALIRYPHHLDGDPVIRSIPVEVPLSGRGALTWDAVHDCAWVVSDASNALFKLAVNPLNDQLIATEFTHPEMIAPQAVDVSDSGRLFVSSEGQILEFELSRRGRALVPAENPIFAGVAAGRMLHVAKSHDNFLPGVHDQPAWYHAPPAHCTPGSSCLSFITRVQAGTINQMSSCEPEFGYTSYPGQSTELTVGESVTVTVHGSISLPADTCGIWVDWDRDFTFDDPRDVVAIGTFDSAAETFSAMITPPADATPGATRMRIRVAEGAMLDPCNGDMMMGETEDYFIIVLPDPCPEDLVDPPGVEQQDLNAVLNRWGDTDCIPGGGAYPCSEDLAFPAGVEQQDLNAVLNRWGDPDCL